MTELKEDIWNFILSTFPIARKNKISYEESLLETGIIDSLGVIEIVNFLIDQLEVEVEEEDLKPENFETVMAIVDLIERKKSAA